MSSARIGSLNNRLTVSVSDDLWLQHQDEAAVDMKINQDDVPSALRDVFRGATPILDALARRDNELVKKLATAFNECTQVGKLKVMRTPLPGDLQGLWGYKPGSVPKI